MCWIKDTLLITLACGLHLGLKNFITGGPIAGINFWSFRGMTRPIAGLQFWKKNDSCMGDPSQEEQGLNSVFVRDASTWNIIRAFTSKIAGIIILNVKRYFFYSFDDFSR
jgi:hypothetical protein